MKSICVAMVLLVASCVLLNAQCTTIQQGLLVYPAGYLAGQPLKPGFDPYGANYQAHLFVGSLFNAYANDAGFPPYSGDDATYLAANPAAASHWAWPIRSVTLNVKWNEAWLSNKDCDGDGKLDRHYGFASFVGSGAWETNHQSETDAEGVHWSYFVKVVAVPSSATLSGGRWYLNGTEIGPAIWGAFAVVEEVYTNPRTGDHPILYKSPLNPGLGYYGHQP